jgi:hypothetical protein
MVIAIILVDPFVIVNAFIVVDGQRKLWPMRAS